MAPLVPADLAAAPRGRAGPPVGGSRLGDGFAAVLEAARTGERKAFERLYDSVAPLVLGYLRGLPVSDPEDVAGEVFVDLVRGLGRFEGDERRFRSWLLTIAHRRAIDASRRRLTRSTSSRPEDGHGPEPEPTEGPATTEDEALQAIGVRRILSAIDALTRLQREAVLLRVVADLTVPEMAEVLGTPESAVKALLRRATAQLRRSLG
jgi:RNA polymerase sigma factor (sigma-70 family)